MVDRRFIPLLKNGGKLRTFAGDYSVVKEEPVPGSSTWAVYFSEDGERPVPLPDGKTGTHDWDTILRTIYLHSVRAVVLAIHKDDRSDIASRALEQGLCLQ